MPTAAVINCNLNVGLRTDNVAVYVCRGKVQCFNFTALKCSCSGNVSIYLLNSQGGTPTDTVDAPNFGTFTINPSGICFKPATNLGDGATEATLYFTATNTVTSPNGGTSVTCETTNFSVKFVYDPCSCGKCCKC